MSDNSLTRLRLLNKSRLISEINAPFSANKSNSCHKRLTTQKIQKEHVFCDYRHFAEHLNNFNILDLCEDIESSR